MTDVKRTALDQLFDVLGEHVHQLRDHAPRPQRGVRVRQE
jgi:hypothetical protein